MNLKKFYHTSRQEVAQLFDGEPLDFRLEQVEKIDEQHWNVVVSFLVEKVNIHELSAAFNSKYERVYKSLTINNDQEVVGFHIYEKPL